VKIEYTLTRDDFFQWFLYQRERKRVRWRDSRWYWQVWLLRWLALTVIMFVFYFAVWKGLVFYAVPLFVDDNRLFAGFAGFATVLALIAIAYSRHHREENKYDRTWALRHAARALEKQGYVGLRCELDVNTTEIIVTLGREGSEKGSTFSYRHESHTSWEQVESIEEFDLHAFITNKAQAGVFIPKAAFPDLIAFREFVATALRYWKEFPTATAITASLPSDFRGPSSEQITRQTP
jgi:hypothetical protein